MDSRKSNSKKIKSARSASSKLKRTTKRRNSIFKKKTIKPKVKLDSNRVIIMCTGIVVACAILLIATIFLPDTSIENSITQKVAVENVQQKEKTQSLDSTKKQENKSDKKLLPEKQKEQKEIELKKTEEKTTQKKDEAQKKDLNKEKNQTIKTNDKKEVVEEKKESKAQEEFLDKAKIVAPIKNSFNFPEAKNNAQIVFLLDDGGQNLSQLEKFTSLKMPLTIAVLPKLANSKTSAQKIRLAQKELMLHQPMQAVNQNVNPGPGAITPEMSESEIISVLYQNIQEVGPVAGINNHEGSAITADAQKMEVILKYINENDMFFLDSRTNKDTQVPFVSKGLGYSYYERNGFFLDNVKTRENALLEIRKNIDKANKDGVVIMIGHVWSADFLAPLLADVYPELIKKGYVVTTVSKCKGKK